MLSFFLLLIFTNYVENHKDHHLTLRHVVPPTKTLNDGNRMPIIALGTLVEDYKDVAKVREAVVWAVKMGYRHIDTAATYNNEEYIGQAIRELIQDRKLVSRKDLFITTKLNPDGHARNQVVPALKESLAKLRLTYVDLFLIHTPFSDDKIDYLETWRGMEEAKRLGLTKSIGVSNFDENTLERLLADTKTLPAVNQIEVNPASTRESLVNLCHGYNIAVTAYSPLGYLVDRGIPDAPPPRINDPILKGIADKYGKTPVQVVLRYLIDRGTIPIPKSVHKDHLKENIEIFDFTLSPEEVETINRFNTNQPIFGWT